MMARLLWYLDRSSPHQQNKPVVKVGPPLTKISGSVQEQPPLSSPASCLQNRKDTKYCITKREPNTKPTKMMGVAI